MRSLTEAEHTGFKETRLRVVKARAGETIVALAFHTDSVWNPEEIAVANGLELFHELKKGQLVKITRAESYVSKKGSVFQPEGDQMTRMIEIEPHPAPKQSEEPSAVPPLLCPVNDELFPSR